MATAVDSTATRAQTAKRGFRVPMLLGPLRGYWWDLKSGGKVTRLLLGSYEREQSQLFEQLVRPGEQVLDVGAATGYYTLLAARLVGKQGRVVAFEPDPKNLQFLQQHVHDNRLTQAEVLPIAIGDTTGTVSFGGGTGTGTHRICNDGEQQVSVRRLDDLAREMELAPQHVKIDVEGHEMAVLRGGEQLFRKCRPTIFLSTHEWIVAGVHQTCCDLLTRWGYDLQPMGAESIESASELLCRPAK